MNEQETVRRRRGNGGDTRKRILDAAAALFKNYGYEGTTVGAIAEALGMTVAALYYHFRSKDDILFAFIENDLLELNSKLKSAVQEGGPEQQLRQFVREHVLYQVGRFSGGKSFGAALHGFITLAHRLDDQKRGRLTALERKGLNTLRDVLSAGMDDGTFRRLHVTSTAFAILGMSAETQLWYKPDSEVRPEKLAETYADLVVEMVRAHGTS